MPAPKSPPAGVAELWNERYAAPFAPVTMAEVQARGWDAVGRSVVTGARLRRSPSFANAILESRCGGAGGSGWRS